MSFTRTTVEDGIATVTLERGKVNALVPEVIDQIGDAVRLVVDGGVRAVILTGSGPFFSFGFDVPHMRHWSRDDFGLFVRKFTTLYRDLFMLPCPLVAAINGHAVAGGCMVALAADARVMATGTAKISLNEVRFGASVFAGAVEMLRLLVDGRMAARILQLGEMFDAEEATTIGLVDVPVPPESVAPAAFEMADELSRHPAAAAGIKKLLRDDVGRRMAELEPDSIEAFLDVWYSEETQAQLDGIRIR